MALKNPQNPNFALLGTNTYTNYQKESSHKRQLMCKQFGIITI